MATGTPAPVINREQIEANLGAVPAALARLAVESGTADLAEVVAAAGFDAPRRAVFVCEGVMQYLTEDRARATIEFSRMPP